MKRRDIGYRTNEFRAKGRGANYPLTGIPQGLWKAFRKRCREFTHRDGSKGISVRARILGLISEDVRRGKVDDVIRRTYDAPDLRSE